MRPRAWAPGRRRRDGANFYMSGAGPFQGGNRALSRDVAASGASVGRALRRWRATSGPWALLCTFVALVYLFSLGPILSTAAVSFTPPSRSFFPPRGFSL